MNSILILLKLSAKEDLYTSLETYLKTMSWARPLSQMWIVYTTKEVVEIRDAIKSRVRNEDSIIVVDITDKDWATSNISKAVTDWMKKNT